jgi:hypothetical protein
VGKIQNKAIASEIIIKACSVPGWNVLLKEVVRLLLLVKNNILKIRKTNIIYTVHCNRQRKKIYITNFKLPRKQQTQKKKNCLKKAKYQRRLNESAIFGIK